MSKQISSIDWFAEQIDELIPYVNDKVAKRFKDLKLQAKDKHFDEILNTYSTAQREMIQIVEEGLGFKHDESREIDTEDATEYYNETFA
jgi:hypothetical protein